MSREAPQDPVPAAPASLAWRYFPPTIPRWYWAAWALLFLVGFGLCLWGPIIYDDRAFILGDPRVVGPWPGWKAFLAITYPELPDYTPVMTLLHRAIHTLFGASWIGPYRLAGLALHLVNVWLLWRICLRLTSDSVLAFWVGALFSIHPAHAEVIMIAAFKKHILVTTAALGALNFLASRSLPPPLRWIGAWLFMALGLMSRESALFLIPTLAALVDWTLKERSGETLPASQKILHAGLLAIGTLFFYLRTQYIPQHTSLSVIPHWSGVPFTTIKCFLWYLLQGALPLNLCLEHDLATVGSFPNAEAVALLGGLGLALALLLFLYHRDRVAFSGFAWSCGGVLPFALLHPYFGYGIVADRYLYLAVAGFFLGTLRLLRTLPSFHAETGSPRLNAIGSVAFAVLWSLLIRHMAHFTDPVELWQTTVACAPNNSRAHHNLAASYLHAHLLDDSIAEYRRSLELSQHQCGPALELAMLYAKLGSLPEAVRILQSEFTRRPNPACGIILGTLYQKQRDLRKAMGVLQTAAMLEPANPETRLHLGLLWLQLQKPWRAWSEFVRIEHHPALYQAYRNLGNYCIRHGLPDLAAKAHRRAAALERR